MEGWGEREGEKPRVVGPLGEVGPEVQQGEEAGRFREAEEKDPVSEGQLVAGLAQLTLHVPCRDEGEPGDGTPPLAVWGALAGHLTRR